MAVTWKKLAYEEDVVTKALFDANTILAADGDNTPAALEIAEQRIVGRKTGGNIIGLTAAEVLTLISVESGADVTDATNVAAAGAIMEALMAAKGDLIGASGNDTPLILTVGANGKVLVADDGEATGLKWDDYAIALDDVGAPDASWDANLQQAIDFVLHTVANAAGLAALTPVEVGQLAWQTDVLAIYVCTVSS